MRLAFVHGEAERVSLLDGLSADGLCRERYAAKEGFVRLLETNKYVEPPSLLPMMEA